MQKWKYLFRYLFLEVGRYNLIFTLIGAYFILAYGNEGQIYILWLKLITFPASMLAYYWSHKNHLYFFHNLGFSVPSLLFFAVLSDLIASVPILLFSIQFG